MQSKKENETVPIETYVFLDVETTGLPSTNYGETKITEISLLSVLRRHFDESPANVVPRVLNKLTMCFHPAKFISPAAQHITGLSNELLEQQGMFNKSFCDLLHNFILRHPQPICILAHNGNRFDFPLLQAHTKILGMPLPEGILCADTLLAFRELKVVEQPPPRHIPHDILEPYTPLDIAPGTWTDSEFSKDILKFLDEVEQSVHEQFGHLEPKEAINCIYDKTPKRTSISSPKSSRLKSPPPHESLTSERIRRRLDFDSESPKKCKPSYSLEAVHQHFFGKCIEGAHSAEADTMALLRCITAIGAPFHNWVQKNHRKLNSILKMW